jgi:hypothetical protein
LSVWKTPSGRSRRWVRRKGTNVPAPLYARLTILIVSVALAATLARYGFRSVVRRIAHSAPTPAAETAAINRLPSAAVAWQTDALASIEDAIHQAQSGNISAAEVAVDRAASVIEAARVESNSAPPDFFETVSRSLDRALQEHPENSRLFEHVTVTRVDLAQLRSAQSESPPQRDSAASVTPEASTLQPRGDNKDDSAVTGAGLAPGREVEVGSPREISANHLFNPLALGGDTIDAKLMPETMEILLPPSTRLFVDNVRVQDLTLKGASQTLDGIHWKNVTFVGTRLRYESGELDLQNVHFLGCTFGVPMDQRGARLANAVALGQTSLTIVE